MDALAGLLDGPRARGAFLLRSVLAPPWGLRIEDGAPLTVVAVVRGEAWLLPVRGEPVRLGPGDVAVVRGPEHYVVADEPATTPRVIIGPGGTCTDLGGAAVSEQVGLGVRTWGSAGADPCTASVLLTGTYERVGEVGRRLLDALPPVITLPPGNPVVGLLADEIGRDGPGQPAVLDRLLDLLLVTTLRAWFDRPGGDVPAWWAAQADPVAGPALRLIENDPAQPWTVESLARAVGVSRAALARRFAGAVGESPIAYLASRRLALAADLLATPELTVAAVARRVGYGSPFTFSTAFKREFGDSPQHWRQRAARPEVGLGA